MNQNYFENLFNVIDSSCFLIGGVKESDDQNFVVRKKNAAGVEDLHGRGSEPGPLLGRVVKLQDFALLRQSPHHNEGVFVYQHASATINLKNCENFRFMYLEVSY
jgi:hypothetical protein